MTYEKIALSNNQSEKIEEEKEENKHPEVDFFQAIWNAGIEEERKGGKR